MLKYTMQRFFAMMLTLFIIMTLGFMVIRLMPGGIFDDEVDMTAEQIAILEAKYHLDKPILTQYAIFLKDVVTQWDWGVSLKLSMNVPVWELIVDKIPVSLYINIFSLMISLPIGIAFGILAAVKKNTWVDYLISTATMVCISVPSFVYAFLIQFFFSFKLPIFPFLMKGGTDYFTWDMFVSMVPAVLSLSFGVIAGFTRTTRAELTEVLTSEFMLLARTKGLTKAQATVRHAMKNCMVVVLPSIFGNFIGILGGSLIIERIFGVPGVGGLTLNAINGRDYNIFILTTCFYTIIGLAASLVVDISYGFIDPRIRMGSKK